MVAETSQPSRSQLEASAAQKLALLLPLDLQTLREIIGYTSSLPGPDQAAKHLTDLLGESDNSLQFIHDFCSRRWSSGNTRSPSSAPTTSAANRTVHATTSSSSLPHKNISKPSDTPIVSDLEKSHVKIPSSHQYYVSPKKFSASGTLSSDLSSANSKQSSKKSVAAELGKNRSSQSIKVKSLHEVEDAIRILEVEYSKSAERTPCDCQAQRHPLLQVAPNCLNCGKIICVKEGMGPCTFCHTPLLSTDEYNAIVTELRQERGHLKSEINNERQSHKIRSQNSATTYSSASGSIGTSPNIVLSGLDNANAQLSNLLQFQATSAQRTRIIDQASDFEMPGQLVDRWSTPAERALQIRKQERTLKQLEAMQRKRNGRGKRVISIDLQGKKVVMRDHSETDYSSEDDENINSLQSSTDVASAVKAQTGFKSISWNPSNDAGRFIVPHYSSSSSLTAHTDSEQSNKQSKNSSKNVTSPPSLLPAALQESTWSSTPRVLDDDMFNLNFVPA
ncbi:putative zinc finger motif, C2HC5-type-domain-containing protein [Lipomyces oligophaga]|uniref:putative zinc finger motif, C2HC5-type-domain-containing protein n=1 Tax=Lipomyces oligophaga TaxID=45792 RepID=UPI0034CE9052